MKYSVIISLILFTLAVSVMSVSFDRKHKNTLKTRHAKKRNQKHLKKVKDVVGNADFQFRLKSQLLATFMDTFNSKFKNAILDKLPEWEAKYKEKQYLQDTDNESYTIEDIQVNQMMLDQSLIVLGIDEEDSSLVKVGFSGISCQIQGKTQYHKDGFFYDTDRTEIVRFDVTNLALDVRFKIIAAAGVDPEFQMQTFKPSYDGAHLTIIVEETNSRWMNWWNEFFATIKEFFANSLFTISKYIISFVCNNLVKGKIQSAAQAYIAPFDIPLPDYGIQAKFGFPREVLFAANDEVRLHFNLGFEKHIEVKQKHRHNRVTKRSQHKLKNVKNAYNAFRNMNLKKVLIKKSKTTQEPFNLEMSLNTAKLQEFFKNILPFVGTQIKSTVESFKDTEYTKLGMTASVDLIEVQQNELTGLAVNFQEPVLEFSVKQNPDNLQQEGVLIHCHIPQVDINIHVEVSALSGWVGAEVEFKTKKLSLDLYVDLMNVNGKPQMSINQLSSADLEVDTGHSLIDGVLNYILDGKVTDMLRNTKPGSYDETLRNIFADKIDDWYGFNIPVINSKGSAKSVNVPFIEKSADGSNQYLTLQAMVHFGQAALQDLGELTTNDPAGVAMLSQAADQFQKHTEALITNRRFARKSHKKSKKLSKIKHLKH